MLFVSVQSLEKIEAILFDLDGTLVDSLPDLHFGIEQVLRKWHLASMSEEEVGRYIGKGVVNLAQRVLQARLPGAGEEEIQKFTRDYVNALSVSGNAHTRLMPTVKESLAALRADGIPLALVTNKAGALIGDVLKKTELEGFFPENLRISPDGGLSPKPAPDMLLLASRRLGVPAGQCAMFGDSRNDALAARAAGMQSVLVRTGYNEGVPIDRWASENGFSAIFDNIGEALKQMQR